MKTNKLSDNIILFTFETKKELTLTFFRIQEFYESQNTNILREKFSVWDFLNEYCDDDGKINYFHEWEGFNIPGDVVQHWMDLHYDESTPAERELLSPYAKKKFNFDGMYFIGALEKDKHTIKHEIAHALFHVDRKYKDEMQTLLINMQVSHSRLYKGMEKTLLKMGYNQNVITDEIQAYLSAEKASTLRDLFNICDKKDEEIVKKFKKVLSKYNKFEI